MAAAEMDLQKMKVADLKKELKERGLTTSGTKEILIDRLQEAIGGDETIESVTDDNLEKSIDQLVQDTPSKPAPEKITVATDKPKENVMKSDANSSTDVTGKKVVSLKGLSDAERVKARAEKFGGAVSESAKKLMRAERFGLPASTAKPLATGGSNMVAATPASPEDLEKMKKRAERFGTVVSDKLSKLDEEERKRKRLEKFGATAITAGEPKKVKLDSSDNDAEAKKRKRAERFGLT